MRQVSSGKIYTVDEYIQHEWTAPERSEFINGQLFEMAGEKDINNEIAGNLYILLSGLLKSLGFYIYNHDVKVKIFNENKYYYPDVFVTREARTTLNRYIKTAPELIIEVVSESSQVNDYVDKYLDYTKIPSLLYYIIVEPETMLITSYHKSGSGEWQTAKYTKPDDEIVLDGLDVKFNLSDVYPYQQ